MRLLIFVTLTRTTDYCYESLPLHGETTYAAAADLVAPISGRGSCIE
jgi:hypothetical protein